MNDDGSRSAGMTGNLDPTVCAAEARVFAEAALRLLTEGECAAAARLFVRASEFAGRSA